MSVRGQMLLVLKNFYSLFSFKIYFEDIVIKKAAIKIKNNDGTAAASSISSEAEI